MPNEPGPNRLLADRPPACVRVRRALGRRTVAVVASIGLAAAACSADDPSPATGDAGSAPSAAVDPTAAATTIAPDPAGPSTDPVTTAPPPTDPPPTAPPSTAPPVPVAIEFELDASTASSATIGPDGGSLTATSADGATFTLVVPEGALFSDETITMTPLASATSPALDDAPATAVRLEPEGLGFARAVELTIAGTGSGPDGGPDRRPFVAGGDGHDVVIVAPARGTGGTSPATLTVRTFHFSVVGTLEVEREVLLRNYRPSTGVQVALLALDEHRRDDSAVADELAWQTLRTWGDGLEQRLRSATGTVRLLELTAELLTFFDQVDATAAFIAERDGDEPNVPDAVTDAGRRAVAAWFDRVAIDVTAFADTCADDPGRAFAIYRWLQLGRVVDALVDTDHSATLEEWRDRGDRCLTFTVTWTSEVVLVDAEGVSTRFDGTASAEVTADSGADVTSLFVSAFGTGPWTLTRTSFGGCFTDLARTAGTVAIYVLPDLDIPNAGAGSVGDAIIESVTVGVGAAGPPTASCPDVDVFAPEWAGLFYVDPLARVNSGRAVDLVGWAFEVPFDPSGRGGEATFEDERALSGTRGTVVQKISITSSAD